MAAGRDSVKTKLPGEHARASTVAFLVDILPLLEPAGQEAFAEGRVGQDLDAEFLASLEDASILPRGTKGRAAVNRTDFDKL